MTEETIAAIATPAGKGGVGIIRVSGPNSQAIAQSILGFVPVARQATYCQFKANNEILDEGIALFFEGPNSFTGEDVLELQGHGGPVVLDRLLKAIIQKEVRLARAGEFSLRAFLNNKIDLTQAEAIADLINADSEQAAKSAVRSLTGKFSLQIHEMVAKLIELRTLVEAAIDFPEEEIDFIKEQAVEERVINLLGQVQQVLATAKQGALLQEGMTLVIAGKPNVGKSSLLNCLSGTESAIVTEIAGTTRDILREHIHIDGMPLHIIDTAGLRETTDIVEQEGMRRARAAMQSADLVLLMIDANKTKNIDEAIAKFYLQESQIKNIPLVVVANKIDLTGETLGKELISNHDVIKISAKNELGIENLKEYLKQYMGFNQNQEGVFIARQRHLTALQQAQDSLQHGLKVLQQQHAGELLAEDLRQAQKQLGEITGEFRSDDLLGEIFSSFCIGK